VIVPEPATGSVVATLQPSVDDVNEYSPEPDPPETPRVIGVPFLPVIELGMTASEDCAIALNLKVTAADVVALYIPFAAFVATTMQFPV